MNRVRAALAVTALLGVIYGFAGLMVSLQEFALGAGIAAAAIIGYGLIDFVESDRRERLARYRAEVWHRRDLEAGDTR